MTNSSPEQRLATFAAQVRALRVQLNADPALAVSTMAVKKFQSARLALTHADLLVHPRYGDAAKFFLFDLYGVKDFSQRDAELARVIPTLQRFLPSTALTVIADAVQLDAISEQLDFLVGQQLRILAKQQPPATGVSCGNTDPATSFELIRSAPANSIPWSVYRSAYCAVDANAPERAMRERQMQLVLSIGSTLISLVRKPLLGGLLKSMGPVAAAAGVGTMHDFLTRGFTAFKAMQDAKPFLQMIQTREQAMHDASVSSDSDLQVLQSQNLMGLA